MKELLVDLEVLERRFDNIEIEDGIIEMEVFKLSYGGMFNYVYLNLKKDLILEPILNHYSLVYKDLQGKVKKVFDRVNKGLEELV